MNEFENNNEHLNSEINNKSNKSSELKEAVTMNEYNNNNERLNNEINNEADKSNELNNVNSPSERSVLENQTSDYGYQVYNSVGSPINNISEENNLNNLNNINTPNNNIPNHSNQINNERISENREMPNPYTQSRNQYDYTGNNQSSIRFITVNKKKKNHKFARRTAVACATIAIFGCSVGFGTVIGLKTSENMPIENNGYSEFKFNDIPEAEQMSISDNNEIINIVKNTSSSVVNISIKAQQTDFFNRIYEDTGSGSGIIYKEDNEKIYIVTNNHVIDSATSVNISITGQEQVPAKLVGKDAQSDVAVISVLKSELQKANITNIKVAEFADSDAVEVGEYVLAIGNALGQGKTVTQGIISAQNKQVNIDGKNLNVLQTDAAINPGNSGGALVNSTGKIIGMNTAKLSGTTVEGTGYALPSTSVKAIADELIANGTISKPYLGISGFTMSDDFMAMYNITTKGVFINGVEDMSAASAAGLKYSDIITSINGTPITTMDELSSAISKCKVGDKIQIGIIRNGYEPMTVTATLMDMNSKF